MRVLIVDDDSNVRRVLARSFERAGFQAATASDGEQAVAELSSQEFEVMISDIEMPRMNGRQLCRHLATEGPYLPECTLIVTSRSEAEERAWVTEFPGVSVVEKPVGPKHLIRLVKQALAAGASGVKGAPEAAGSQGAAGTPGSPGPARGSGPVEAPGAPSTAGAPSTPGDPGTPDPLGTAGAPGVCDVGYVRYR